MHLYFIVHITVIVFGQREMKATEANERKLLQLWPRELQQ